MNGVLHTLFLYFYINQKKNMKLGIVGYRNSDKIIAFVHKDCNRNKN